MTKWLLLFVLLVPACRVAVAIPPPSSEQFARFRAILNSIKVDDETSLSDAEDALATDQYLQLLSGAYTDAQPGVSRLTMQQDGVRREAFLRLIWKINPRKLALQALQEQQAKLQIAEWVGRGHHHR